MKVGIIGAGIAGLAAAHDLAKAGHQVTVYEAASVAGGLASGFQDDRWEWPLERFYHHLFETDTALRNIVRDIGFEQHLFFRSPLTAQWWQGKTYALDGVVPVLKFPAIPFIDRVRFGMAIAYLKFVTNNWKELEKTTASEWSRRWMGEKAFKAIVLPLLEGKFGPYANQVNMAWLWSRFKARSFKLGYFDKGFQGFVNALLDFVRKQGVTVHLQAPITKLTQLGGPVSEGRWRISTANGIEENFDTVIATGSPALLEKLLPQMPESYLAQLKKLKSMGAVVLTVALKQPLMQQTYWLNMPKDQFPFLALVEHTNFIESKHYGGDHLIYCGDYLDPSHEYFSLTKEQLLERFMPALKKVNPNFDESWVRDSWLHREAYAQPIVPINHSQNIPDLETPLPGLYWASMSQVYPWDRGTNFAVELGQRVAAKAMQGK